MRVLLWMWFVPMSAFWGWYLASAADLSAVFFSRELHDRVFMIYGNVLGIDPQIIPGLAFRACVLDSFIVLGIFAFARRKRIAAWFRERRAAEALA